MEFSQVYLKGKPMKPVVKIQKSGYTKNFGPFFPNNQLHILHPNILEIHGRFRERVNSIVYGD